MSGTLVTLALIFAQLSLLAFGGGNTVLPEMQRQVVDIHHWMTAQEFGALFALAQAAPGPNMMVVPLVGWHVAGFSGVLVTSLAKFGPSSLVTGFALRLWERFKDRPWRRTVQAGLVPVTAGLVTASAIVITHTSVSGWGTALIAALVAIATTTTRIHPLLALAVGAVLGLTGIGQP
ncbi:MULTISPECIES: chromate transporter [unclassified Bradyrhizobium]|uniref:chromate transporter n=1 Tax=unclassified Bradyrhizobium TaxID=2631580 RepID=UPI000414C766|nr:MULTISPECIES: chromate transporter [unclassified Bradyrhizobium]QIG95129.1 chromate transporter [Bradyrhizobium sp. 6(2017)]